MPVQLIAAAVMIGLSIYQSEQAKKNAEQAKEDMENYEREAVTNPFMNLSKYPSLAYKAATDAANNELATTVNTGKQYGRGLAVLPKATDTFNKRQTKIKSDIEKYEFEREKLVAGGEVGKQQRISAQEDMDIEGLSTMYGVSKYNQNEAMVSAGSGVVYGADAAYNLYG